MTREAHLANHSPRTSYDAVSRGGHQDWAPLGLQSLQEDDKSVQMIDTHGWERVFMDFRCLGKNQRSMIDVLFSLLSNTLHPLKPVLSCIRRGNTHSPLTSM